ncbi:hypothetical protein [Chitinophaga pinensis]|uniref:Uncharacterized protein n=1 Tax=Chitinophaga pinensis (strain ATCC 43595 / DSM 2588 / LMG 13176 / NBRC 15968 / NCIMB 11800 / UQM 2034) TaxID=485918 RepID=A0A979G4Y7_CHIPD|nr:hypothetical protein [Chitinophaga pinensis]ACU60990.1 hypothetical protein Cpin_3526 [Chitinophaga pinensis DSM 2588]
MGSRVNYVIKNKEKITIYHHRWGAIRISHDLYAGETAFLKYVKECDIHTHLREDGWMEGFVLVDMEKKLLGFWSWELERETSVLRYYLSALQEKWPGWQLIHLANYMYDAEPLIGFNYISAQTIPAFKLPDPELMMNDGIPDDCPCALVIARQDREIFVAETMEITVENIICYGEQSVPLLRRRPAIPLPLEGETRTPDHIFIDLDNKWLIVNDSIFGIWETMAHKWPGYTLKMGCIGYLAMLEAANIPTAGLEMPHSKVMEGFEQMTSLDDLYK